MGGGACAGNQRAAPLSAQAAAATAPPAALPARAWELPYDQAELETGIVHFGVGQFHRAHQEAYLDELLRHDFARSKAWGCHGVGVLWSDSKMRDVLAENGGRFAVVTRDAADAASVLEEFNVLGSLTGMTLGPEHPERVVAMVADPGVRVVSLTITEFGYNVPLNDLDRALLDGELRGPVEPPPEGTRVQTPTTFGYIAAGLRRRFEAGLPPFTVMSCDNLPGNGERAKQCVEAAVAFAGDEDFSRWVAAECRFPCTMVDRITPATTAEDVEAVHERYNCADDWPVVCESFKQWVIEDDFVGGARPEWELVGAQLVSDVYPHELAKIRLLNVMHSVMCYPAILLGLEHVHEAVTHPTIRPFLEEMMASEVRATLERDERMAPVVPSLRAYQAKLLERFGNCAVKDQLRRIAMDMSQKFEAQGLPLVLDGLAAGLPMRGMALAVACWARFAELETKRGEPLRDPKGAIVAAALANGGLELLLSNEIFGELTTNESWRGEVIAAYRRITDDGVEAALQRLTPATVAA